jgi:hypothetical protein
LSSISTPAAAWPGAERQARALPSLQPLVFSSYQRGGRRIAQSRQSRFKFHACPAPARARFPYPTLPEGCRGWWRSLGRAATVRGADREPGLNRDMRIDFSGRTSGTARNGMKRPQIIRARYRWHVPPPAAPPRPRPGMVTVKRWFQVQQRFRDRPRRPRTPSQAPWLGSRPGVLVSFQ